MNREEVLKKVQNRKPNQMDEMELDILQRLCHNKWLIFDEK